VKHNAIITMADGKTCSSVTDVSTRKCYVCGATPKEMNNIRVQLTRTPDIALNFGFLHLCIDSLLRMSSTYFIEAGRKNVTS
jgi:hypothetical protein